MKGYIIFEIVATFIVIVGLSFLFSGSIILAGLCILMSLVIDSFFVHKEVKTTDKDRVTTMKGLHDWDSTVLRNK